jgi:hypothetical protein
VFDSTKYSLKRASLNDLEKIWLILRDAIARRKADGSNQWQDGYPNQLVIENDIFKNAGYIFTENDKIIGYVAILINDEPEYNRINGRWLSSGDFVVFHRMALAETHVGRGLACELFNHIEFFAHQNGIKSIKADTNFDNIAMLTLFNRFEYVYCGEVTFRGSSRKAFQKML